MKHYTKSLCATCINISFCVLTTNKSFIHSCSEYYHVLNTSSDRKIQVENFKQKQLVLKQKEWL